MNEIQTDPEIRLIATPDIDQKLRAEARQAREEGRERCGFLLGEKIGSAILVYWMTEPGPQATLNAVHCEPDYVVAARAKQKLSGEFENVDFVGGWHIHLAYGDALSGGDIQTLKRADAHQPNFVALLINIDRANEMTFNAYVWSEEKQIRCQYQVQEMTPRRLSEPELNIWKEVHSERFDRTREILPHPTLAKKKILVAGLGSGGSSVVRYLGRAGLFRWTLVDPEPVEPANLARHEALPKDIGRQKTEVVHDMLKAMSLAMQVETLDLDVSTDPRELRRLTVQHDLVLACSGDPLVNALMNQVALDTGIPTIFAGVYPKAIGGYVLQMIPGAKACFNCLYDLSKNTASLDSNRVIRETAARYGLNEDDLRAQQGIYIDISFVALLQAKMALLTLLRGVNHDLGNWKGNLILWNSHDLWIKSIDLPQREDCAICNPEGWMRSKEQVGFNAEVGASE